MERTRQTVWIALVLALVSAPAAVVREEGDGLVCEVTIPLRPERGR